ncbi:hypothetical protein LCU01_06880 [Latilactobacillus curvatus]|nr:hypothetical protein LCU01_06880 [Latilactobacillus curvatus]
MRRASQKWQPPKHSTSPLTINTAGWRKHHSRSRHTIKRQLKKSGACPSNNAFKLAKQITG